jgi:hypothetical protein
MKNISAWTAPTVDADYVPFISVNRTGEHDELVEISLRQKGQGQVPHATLSMTKAEFALFLVDSLKNL